jgi:putative salt-induced outer membrane protein
MRTPASLPAACLLLGFVTAHAEDAPAPVLTGDPTWASRGQLGFSKTSGNSDTTAANFLIHAAHTLGDDWKFLMGAEGLYGSTHGETTAQAWDVHGQANYNLTPRLYWYGGLRYDEDRFSGFAYQAALTTGTGYQFIKTDATKLTGQVGAGVRRLQPELLVKDETGGIISSTKLDASTDAVFDASLTFEHSFNAATKLLADAAVESGQDNTRTTASVSLQVKMTGVLALAAGVQMTHNSQPPAGAVATDTLSTLNLVYEMKNPKLAPE